MKYKRWLIFFGLILLVPLILAMVFSFISAALQPEPNYEQGIYAKSWEMFMGSYLFIFYILITPATLGIFFVWKRKIYASLIFLPSFFVILGSAFSKTSNYLFDTTKFQDPPMGIIRNLTNIGNLFAYLGLVSTIISPIFLAISLIKYVPTVNQSNIVGKISIMIAAVIISLAIARFWIIGIANSWN